MVNPFRKTSLRFQKESQKSTEEKKTADSPREPSPPPHALQNTGLSAIHENSGSSSQALSLSLSLSLPPSPVEILSVVSSMNMKQLLELPSSEEEAQRAIMSSTMAPPSSIYDGGSANGLDYEVESMDHQSPTSYILDSIEKDQDLEMEMEFKLMTPLMPESKSPGDGDDEEEEEEDDYLDDTVLADFPAHLLPLSPLSPVPALKVSKPSTPHPTHQGPPSAGAAINLKNGTSSLSRSPVPELPNAKSISMNPNIALSNDQLDRHILSTQEDEDTVIPGGLTRSNAMTKHNWTAKLDSIEVESRLSRAKSVSKSFGRNSDGASPPLLFSQSTSLSRSKSLNSVGVKSKLNEEVTAEVIANSVKKRTPTLSMTAEAGSIIGDDGQRQDLVDTVQRPLGSQLSTITNIGGNDPESPYFVLTNDAEFNYAKEDNSSKNIGTVAPPGSKVSTSHWYNSFKGNFYKAEDNSLNPGPQDTNMFIGAVAVPPILIGTEKVDGNYPRVEENEGLQIPSEQIQRKHHRHTYTEATSQARRLFSHGSRTNDNGDPEDPNKGTAEKKRIRRDKGKTIGIWCLIVIIVVLLCTLVPQLVLYSRGTDEIVQNYLSNITPEHRFELLEPYKWEISPLKGNIPNMTASSRTPEAELEDLEMKSILTVTKEVPSGRVRGGLRNSKFKTQTIAGTSKFSQIPPVFQRSNQLRSAMENDQLHNVFYGIDYAPKNVIYPECGVSLHEVMLDLGLLSQVTSRIRTYGTQCNQTRYILDSIRMLNLNVSLSVGVWIGANEETNERQIRDLKSTLSDYPREYFESVFVGNEVLFREDQSPERLIRYIQEVKSFVQMELNWDLPVGTSDVGHKTDPSVLNSCDFYGSNTHPFFQGDSVEGATKWVFDFMQYQIEPFKHLAMTESKIPKVMISEVGWPSAGGSYKNSTAGEEQLQQFLDAWVCEANNQKYPWYFFEAFDEPWKMVYHREGAEWETHWGLFTEDRTLKDGIRLPNCSITLP